MFATGRAPHVSAERILRKLGVPAGMQPADAWLDTVLRVTDWYSVHGQPWCATQEVRIERLEPSRVHLERTRQLDSEVVARGFATAGVSSAILVAASAGIELDLEVARLQATGQPDSAWFLAAYGACVAERLREDALAETPELLPAYAPGYRGWQLDDQVVLYDLLRDRGPLRLGPSCCLTPLRSCMAIAGRVARDIEIEGFWAAHGGSVCKGDCLRCNCSKN